MDFFSHNDVSNLAARRQGPCLSLFLPTHRAGEDTQQDPIRLKNLLRKAEQQLVAAGTRLPEAAQWLEPSRQLLYEGLFWSHLSDGLALYLAPGFFRYYRVPLRLEESLVVASRFHVKPLLPLLTGDGHFFVLALSQKSVRLLEGTRHRIDEVELEGVPTSLAEILAPAEQERQLQFHTRTPGGGGRRAAIFHGHGVGEEEAKERLQRFFRRIDDGLRDLLRGEVSPLVLAGTEYYFPLYREVNRYPHLLNKGIPGNPEALRLEELHQQAWPLVEPRFRLAEEQALAQYRQLAGTGRTSSDVREILPAACQGRVDVLFVAVDHPCWGTLDTERQYVDVHSEPRSDSDDLSDRTAVETLFRGGTVYAPGSESIPGDSPLAAIYRY